MSGAQSRLRDLGWTAHTAESFASYETFHYPARVCHVDPGGADLAGAAGAVRATLGGELLGTAAADRAALPAVGDWAAVRDWPDGRVTLEALLPRRTAIARGGADCAAAGQAVAANVDLVVIVDHLEPEPDLNGIERLLELTRGSGAVPLVVLTKAELVPNPAGMRAEVAAVVPDVEVIALSTATGDGFDALTAHLAPGRTLGLMGLPGAGASTVADALTNLLAGAHVMPSSADRELIVLPGRGVLVDTPGLRDVALER